MSNESISDTVLSIVHSFRIAMRTALKANENGLNGMHVRCLSYIARSGSCTANDIVNHFSRDKAQIARLIKEMTQNNWLEKKANPSDKRSQLLSLTDEGRELAEQIIKAQKDIHKKMIGNLSEEELKEFRRVALIMSDNLRDE